MRGVLEPRDVVCIVGGWSLPLHPLPTTLVKSESRVLFLFPFEDWLAGGFCRVRAGGARGVEGEVPRSSHSLSFPSSSQAEAPSLRPIGHLGKSWRLVRSPPGPSLFGVGAGGGILGSQSVGSDLASVVPGAEGLGDEGDQSRPQPPLPLPCPLAGCCLGAAALVRRPGQAEAEKLGSMAERGFGPSRDAGTRVGGPAVGGGLCTASGRGGVQHRMAEQGLGWLEWAQRGRMGPA